MDLQSIADRVKGILLEPRKEWEKIRTEQTSNKELILYYVLPFVALAALISLLAIWSNNYLGFWLALRFAVLQLVLPIITVIVTAVVINELAETFNSSKDLNSAMKLMAYSYTPFLLINIITSISWTLGFLSLLGLYGVYLLWVGLPVMMKTPKDKRLAYIVAAFVAVLLVNIIISALFGIDRLGYY
jgi:hypothetical protein